MAAISREPTVEEVDNEEDTEAIISEILGDTKGPDTENEKDSIEKKEKDGDVNANINIEANTDYNPNSMSQLSNENIKSSNVSLSFLDR